QAEDGIRAFHVTGVQTCALPILLDRHPIGTGPFQFIEFRKDLLIRYGANANYWQGAPAIKHLVYSITPNANKRMLKLITGECDEIGRASCRERGMEEEGGTAVQE